MKLLQKPLRVVEVILWLQIAIIILTPTFFGLLKSSLLFYTITLGLLVSPFLMSIAFIKNRFRRYKIPLFIALVLIVGQIIRLIGFIYRGTELQVIQQALSAISFYLIIPVAIFLKKGSK